MANLSRPRPRDNAAHGGHLVTPSIPTFSDVGQRIEHRKKPTAMVYQLVFA